MKEVTILPGDLGLTNSFRAPEAHTRLLARAIAALTRRWGEDPTRATHAFIVTKGGSLRAAEIIESQERTREGRLWDLYAGTGKEVSIWRLRRIGTEARRSIATKALSYRNTTYGWWKLLAHMADWYLGGVYLFRRLLFGHRYPMCSWVAAHSYTAVWYRFGKPPDAVQPDDMWDYANEHPEEWECIRPLSPIEGGVGWSPRH